MENKDKQLFFKSLIKEIQIYEEPVGKQWLKSIKFTFPLLGGSDEISLDNESRVETVVLLSKGMVDKDNYRKVKVDFSLKDMDLTELRDKAT